MRTYRSTRRHVVAYAGAVALGPALLLTGCSSSSPPSPGGSSGPSATSPVTPSPSPAESGSAEPSATATATATTPPAAEGNELFPLQPGFQSVRLGRVTKGRRRVSHRLVFTVTDVSKKIDGVRAITAVDQDFDGGELAEQSLEFFALDAKGNVRYLGSYTETYEAGQFVTATDAWLAGVNGAKSGILVPARPRVGASFVQAVVPGEGTARATVIRTGARQCVPFRCFTGVVVMREGGSERKYYAPGVGGILTAPGSGAAQETEELVNVTALSPKGLAEISDEAVRLDKHARSVARRVYGGSAPAKRAG